MSDATVRGLTIPVTYRHGENEWLTGDCSAMTTDRPDDVRLAEVHPFNARFSFACTQACWGTGSPVRRIAQAFTAAEPGKNDQPRRDSVDVRARLAATGGGHTLHSPRGLKLAAGVCNGRVRCSQSFCFWIRRSHAVDSSASGSRSTQLASACPNHAKRGLDEQPS